VRFPLWETPRKLPLAQNVSCPASCAVRMVKKKKNRKSKIENLKSKIENRKSKIENRKSKIENRKSKIENRKSKIIKEAKIKNPHFVIIALVYHNRFGLNFDFIPQFFFFKMKDIATFVDIVNS
jgi:hypothetical protein